MAATRSTLEAHKVRWTFLKAASTVGALTPGHAIDNYFLEHPEVGSPLTAEEDWADREGGRIRVFSGGIAGWSPAGGVEFNPQP